MAPTRRTLLAVLLLGLATVLGACSGDSGEKPDRPASSVALRVTTVPGAEQLDESTRTRLETEVGDVLSGYVVRAFLGDYPRQDFVGAFGSFTIGAARDAANDIDLLTAARFREAAAVRATTLDARLSFLVRGEDVIGATARVRFAFEATMADGTTRPFTLRGRLMLVHEKGTWSVFGYDVARDDGGAVQEGEAS